MLMHKRFVCYDKSDWTDELHWMREIQGSVRYAQLVRRNSGADYVVRRSVKTACLRMVNYVKYVMSHDATSVVSTYLLGHVMCAEVLSARTMGLARMKLQSVSTAGENRNGFCECYLGDGRYR